MNTIPKPFQLHSGNNILNSEYYALCYRIIYQSSYEQEQNERVAEIRTLLNKYHSNKEIIIEGLRNELSKYANDYRNRISKASNKMAFGIFQIRLNAVENLLNWLNTGMVNFTFKPIDREKLKSKPVKISKSETNTFKKLSYIEKLHYWSNKGLEYYTSTYFIDENNSISILPEKGNFEQYQQYFVWYSNCLKEVEPGKYNAEILKNLFFKNFNDNPNANKLRLKELSEYEERLSKKTIAKDKSFIDATLITDKAFNEGYNSVLYKRNVCLEYEFLTTYGAIESINEGIVIAEMITLLSNTNIQQPTDEGNQPQHDVTNHFCKSMPLNFAREHFKALTTTNSKNGNPFLTDEQFEKFIQRAFCGNNKMPKQKINLVTREKWFVVRRFYEFYQYSVSESYEFQQSRVKFIKLLTDNFTGWVFEDIKKNFNKAVKRKW